MVKCRCFFSSRRRHTRYWRDWSSDVCSSDLDAAEVEAGLAQGLTNDGHEARQVRARGDLGDDAPEDAVDVLREDDERPELGPVAGSVDHGSGRLVARRLDAEQARRSEERRVGKE